MKKRLILSLMVLMSLLLALVEGPSQPAAMAGSLGPGAEPARQPGDGSNPDPAPSLPTGASADWWSAVLEEIVKSEYNITWQDSTYLGDLTAAYQAPNRANNLRAYFTAAGPIVIPRTGYEGDDAPPWRWTACLVAWGRAGDMGPVPEAELAVQDNKIRYDRGDLTEWYLNDEAGLEQGFALRSPPVTESGEHLRLEFALGGSLSAQAGEEGTRIEFGEEGGEPVLAYGRLRATDAQGRELPAQLELQGSTLILVIDDSQATYPLDVTQTINGLPPDDNWYQPFPSTSQGGFSVATAGDVNGDGYSDAIVGAPYYDGGETDEGRAYVFYGSPIGLLSTGPWVEEGDQGGARFGSSVSTAGDVNGDGYSDVIIGAPRFNEPTTQTDEGAFWVYHGSSAELESTHSTHKQGNQAHAHFGQSVSTAGDVDGDGYSDVIVGAPWFNDGQDQEGHVWVWRGSSAGLIDTPHWQAQIDEPYAEFGTSVATAGDVNGDGYSDVIVGAPGVSVEYDDEGAIFAWHGSQYGVNNGDDGTDMNRDWFFRSGADSAQLGFSVATTGDVNGDGYSDVILGAPYAYYGEWGAGRAYYSLGGPGGLEEVGRWDYLHGENGGDHFGWSVATAGDVNGDGYADLIVGAPHFVDDSTEKGRAYLWYGSGSGVGTEYDWDVIGVGTDAYLGTSVATAGDVNGDGYSDVIVGSPGYLSQKGIAYVYHGGPDNPSETADWTKVSNLELAQYGMSVGTAGDVNGDGYADIIVGSPRWDGGKDYEGAVWVYHGNAGLMNTAPDFYKRSNQELAGFGTSVGTAGDVNGDGYDDIIVGSPFWDHDAYTDAGAAWIYRGSSDGLVDAPLWHKAPNHAGGEFGTSVGTAGDVNGDGYADVIVGAPYYDHGMDEEGMAWVYLGADPVPSTTPQWDGEGNQINAHYGQAVGTAGDVNGDGYSDIIVGAPDYNVDAVNEGRAWVYHGSAHGVEDAWSWRQRGSVGNAHYGFAVGTAGDVNGDHYSDIIVGAPHWYDDMQDEGKVWVYRGSGDGVSGSSSWRKEGDALSAFYGYSVGTAGDVNGDGYADVIIGIQNSSEGELYEGGASLYYGSGTGLEDDRAWHGQSDKASAHYGESVGTAGDVNGDGYADIIVGVPHFNTNYFDEGKVFLYYGNGRPGVDMRIQQFRGAGPVIPIPHLGHSNTLDSFRVGVRGRTPYGRAWYRAELEVKAFGVPFSGDYGPYSWHDSEAGDTALRLTVHDLPAGTQYHWRVRLRYDPVLVPYQPYSRWMHMPWNGWQEADLRTASFRLTLPLILKGYE